MTSNSYGARCLNTPNVFFADIDFQYDPSWHFSFAVFGLLLLGAGGVGWGMSSRSLGVLLAFLALGLCDVLSKIFHRLNQGLKGGVQGGRPEQN